MDMDPAGAEQIARDYPCTTDVSVVNSCPGWITLQLTLRPPNNLVVFGFPVERVHLSVSEDGEVLAFPVGEPDRTWEHRNPAGWQTTRADGNRGELCLQYADDPDALRWLPEDGLGDLIALVHRHLIYEEAFRQDGKWPVEAAPHGTPRQGVHPITSPEMRKAQKLWAR